MATAAARVGDAGKPSARVGAGRGQHLGERQPAEAAVQGQPAVDTARHRAPSGCHRASA